MRQFGVHWPFDQGDRFLTCSNMRALSKSVGDSTFHLFCKKYALFKTLVDCDIVILSKFLQQFEYHHKLWESNHQVQWNDSSQHFVGGSWILFSSYHEQVDAVKYHLSIGLRWDSAGDLRILLYHWLVVWNMIIFSIIYGRIIRTDIHIFQRGRSTTNQDQIECFENLVPSTLSIQC